MSAASTSTRSLAGRPGVVPLASRRTCPTRSAIHAVSRSVTRRPSSSRRARIGEVSRVEERPHHTSNAGNVAWDRAAKLANVGGPWRPADSRQRPRLGTARGSAGAPRRIGARGGRRSRDHLEGLSARGERFEQSVDAERDERPSQRPDRAPCEVPPRGRTASREVVDLLRDAKREREPDASEKPR